MVRRPSMLMVVLGVACSDANAPSGPTLSLASLSPLSAPAGTEVSAAIAIAVTDARGGPLPEKTIRATTSAAPVAPTNLLVQFPLKNMKVVSWTDNSSAEDGFELTLIGDVCESDGSCLQDVYILSLSANTTSYQIPSSDRPYSIRAYNESGYSDYAYAGSSARGLRPSWRRPLSGKTDARLIQ